VTVEYIKRAKTIFWDFDGVIKDSVTVKSDAFEQLFLPFGEKIAVKVRKHHEANGGMSRFDKLPIYLEWVGQEAIEELTTEYEEKFSLLVKQKVINSDWVLGSLDYLKNNHHYQQFFLITATPQQEIEEILSALKINQFFEEVIGAPTKKGHAIKQILVRYNITSEHTVMIGDSNSDYIAAVENKIPFVLRKTDLNKKLQNELDCEIINNFL
jgi:phosphoglycolate phosphatase-like HAD superfamily hydrolase